jgi:hypothetical protein
VLDRGTFGDSIFFKHQFVDVAPHPTFSGLDGTNDGMFRGMEVFCGVLIFGRVATADVPTGETKPKVNPSVAHFEALFAAVGMRLYFFDLI